MLQPQKIQNCLNEISQPSLPIADLLKRNIFMYGMWLLGIPAFIYGAADRGVAAFAKQTIAITDFSYCMIALVALFCWLAIGLAEDPLEPISQEEEALMDLADAKFSVDCIAQQRYRLPFPHLCQIYHLLNLKHLEEIHRFSLGNLKVTNVSHFKKTKAGGLMRFKTVLDSPLNVLRMWRDPSAEVDLILHAPHQIELKVPAYGQKFIHVLFSVLPLNAEEHVLSIKMFSDLQWPKELLRAILIIAASLTLLEDLPYLSQLATCNVGRSGRVLEGTNSAQAMQLFQRYVHLYGGHWETKQLRSLH